MSRNRTKVTLGHLLNDLKKDLPSLKVGMFFETIKSIYPSDEMPKESKNIILEDNTITKPLALSRKEKKEIVKENSPLKFFINENTKGDFLKIVKKEEDIYFCENVSLAKDVKEKYYKNDDYIKISEEDIINYTVKPIIRIRHSYLYNYMEEKNGN